MSFPGLQVVKVRDRQIVVEGFDKNWKSVDVNLISPKAMPGKVWKPDVGWRPEA